MLEPLGGFFFFFLMIEEGQQNLYKLLSVIHASPRRFYYLQDFPAPSQVPSSKYNLQQAGEFGGISTREESQQEIPEEVRNCDMQQNIWMMNYEHESSGNMPEFMASE